MHCEVNFPGTKQQSDLDVPLPIGMEDDAYYKLWQNITRFTVKRRQIWCCTMLALTPCGRSLGKISLNRHWYIRREMQVLSTV